MSDLGGFASTSGLSYGIKAAALTIACSSAALCISPDTSNFARVQEARNADNVAPDTKPANRVTSAGLATLTSEFVSCAPACLRKPAVLSRFACSDRQQVPKSLVHDN